MGLSEKLAASVAAATWLTEADQAAIATAELLAERLEAAYDPAEVINYAKALQGVLTALGLTVAGRTGKAEPKGELGGLDAIIRSTDDLRKPAAANSGRAKPKPKNTRRAS